MCLQTSRPGKTKPAPITHGTCRWLTPDAKELLLSGMPAFLEICVQQKRGECKKAYAVSPVEGGWLMSEQTAGGEFKEGYWINAAFTSCSCPAAEWSHGPCKHLSAAKAALRRIGMAQD